MRPLLFLFGVFFVLLAQAAQPLTLEGTHRELLGHLAVRIDATNTLDIGTVSAPASGLGFRDLDGNLNLGFTRATVWLRFTLKRPATAPANWWLEVAPPYLDDVTLYVPQADGGFAARRTGDDYPFGQREVAYRNPVFSLDLPVDLPQTFYLRVRTINTMYGALDLWQPQAFVEMATRNYIGWGIFAGMSLAMILSSLWFWRVTRDLEYLLLTAFAAFTLMAILASGGYVQQWLLPNTPWLHDRVLGSSLALGVAAAAHFINRFTQLAHHLPRVERVFTLGAWGVALFGCAGFWLGRYPETMPVVQMAALATSLLNTALTAYLVWRRQPQAMTMLFAMTTFWLVIPVRMLQTLGWISRNFDSDFLLNLSMLLFLGVLNFAGHQRYLRIRRDNEAAQAQALEAAQQAAQILETRVAERTRNLRDALEQVEQARELERAMHREQRQFVATISHELRTPLSVIDATTQNLILLNGPNLEATARNRIGKVQLAADRMKTIIDESLKPERFGVLDGTPSLATVPLHDMLADAAEAAQAVSEGHRIIVECPPAATAYCDPELFRLVLRTLVDNAVKYTPAGSSVRLRGTADDDVTTITVTDDGPGIPPDELPHIFERYFRGRAAAAHAGTGLGLPLARHIVTQSGGTLAVASDPGQGTTVTLQLPSAPK